MNDVVFQHVLRNVSRAVWGRGSLGFCCLFSACSVAIKSLVSFVVKSILLMSISDEMIKKKITEAFRKTKNPQTKKISLMSK